MKILQKLSGVLVCGMLLVPAGGYSHASEKQEVKPSMQVYDSKGKLEKSYSDQEIKKFMEEAKVSNLQVQAATNKLQAVAASSTTSYGASSFSNYVNINGGKYYYNPKDITVNPIGYVKAIIITLIKDSGGSKSIKLTSFQGGVHVPLSSLRSGDGRYKVQFKNGYPETKLNLKGGTLYYN
ncbi:hypothetical protein OKW24_005723 [Peribacillus simplex]|uniref:hypothetical protein n=1 Tax=Peribacillus simplex TaxID=1478 RepID=UPI0024E266F7|nr:hypothetical protein [Peribacillus simplex]MDF9763827.1 hypothetical protein [Peribacillus simplex]